LESNKKLEISNLTIIESLGVEYVANKLNEVQGEFGVIIKNILNHILYTSC